MEPTDRPEPIARAAGDAAGDARDGVPGSRVAQDVRPDPASGVGDVAAAIRSYLSVFEQGEESAQSSSNEFLALDETARIVARETGADRLVASAFKKIATLLDVDLLRLYRIDSRRGELGLAASHGASAGATNGAGLSRSLEPFRKNGRRHKGPVTVEESLGGPGMTDASGPSYVVLSIPIVSDGELWGVFQAAVRGPRRFTASESNVLETAAGLIGSGLLRIEAIDRAAMLRAKLERKSGRIVELYRKLRDVRTDLESKNRSLAEAISDLRQLETMKDAFVSSISHEMRTPLTIIRSYVDLLLNYQPDTREKELEFLRVVDAETLKLIHQINKILHLTEIRGNDVRLQIESHATADLARSALEEAKSSAEEKGLRVVSQLADDLPNLSVDREKAIQVLVDLLDNAVKFSPAGGAVTLGARETPADRSGPSVTLWVADEGPGIDPESQGRIFEQFAQIADAATGKPRGIGLGLPICRAYVERMGGKMWVESEPEKGSTFFVSLPATTDSR